MLCCPAHDDRNPSLAISERDGRILVKCFAGCTQADVIETLKSRGLWPESSHPRR
jgi:putative DNA primase/helicase